MISPGRLKTLVSTALLAVGLGFFVYANWLQLKAELAQVLIARAWQETRQVPDQQHKPWSWADFWPVAKLQAAGIDPVYVLSSSNGQALAFGPGHMSESTTPGDQGQVIIAGHKDSHFAFLQNSQLGDILQLEDSQGTNRKYAISHTEIVDSTKQTLQVGNKDELLLITCYPFNSLEMNGPLRLVVTAIPI